MEVRLASVVRTSVEAERPPRNENTSFGRCRGRVAIAVAVLNLFDAACRLDPDIFVSGSERRVCLLLVPTIPDALQVALSTGQECLDTLESALEHAAHAAHGVLSRMERAAYEAEGGKVGGPRQATKLDAWQ